MTSLPNALIFINSGLHYLPQKMNSTEAICQLLTIGLQESRFVHTTQVGGPAHGYWQFEKGGGVKGIMTHEAVKGYTQSTCAFFNVAFDAESIYQALPGIPTFAAALARLLLWTDPKPLPKCGDVEGSWDLYNRVWRPGKPHSETWEVYREQACQLLGIN